MRSRDEHSLLFDLDALMSEEPPADPLPFDENPARAPTMVPLVPLVPIAAPPRRSRLITALTAVAVVLAGGLALAAAGGVAWSLSQPAETSIAEPPTAQTPTRIVVGQRPTESPPTPDPPAAVTVATALIPTPPPAEPPTAAAPEAEPQRAARRTPKTRPTRKTPRARPEKPRAPKPPQVEDRPPAPETRAITVAPKPESAPESAIDEVDRMLGILDEGQQTPSGSDPEPPPVRHAPIALPERLTRPQIMRGVQKINPRMRACPGAGRYEATLRITPAGRVDRVTVRGDDPAARACVERTVRQMTFPRFGGDAMSVKLPFML